MAVLVRCSRPPSATNPSDLSRLLRPSPLSGGVHVPEKLHLLPSTKQKAARFSIRVLVSSEEGSFSTVRNFLCLKGDISQTNRSGESHGYGNLSVLFHMFMEYLSDPKRMASFSKAFILANTSMLILPLEVLAETCEPDNSIFSMPLLFIVALIGATVGGLLARQRRGELKRLNDQLRQINEALRRQAKIESYAPNLSYAPVGRTTEATEVIIDPRKQQLVTNLRTGKNYLRNQNPEKAFTEFKAALELSQSLEDHIEEKKAARGLGASLQRQGKYRDAIKYHSRVLEICKLVGEDSGSTEAYGAIADCYTELGDLEQAGKFYDKYIARLKTD